MEERLKKMTLEMEALQRENKALKHKDMGSEEGIGEDRRKQLSEESQNKEGRL